MKEENQNGIEPHSVTYWESRQINIGDYESISFGATSIVKFIPVNVKEKKVEISEAKITVAYPRMTERAATDSAQDTVKRILDEREKTIRLQSNSNGGTSFDTLKKAQDFGIVKESDLGLTQIKDYKDKAKAKADFDAEFEEDDFDAPAKPVVKKALVKKPAEIPKTVAKKKFNLKPSGLFAKTPKVPDNIGFDPDETIDL